MPDPIITELRQCLDEVTIPRGGQVYSVSDYFRLPPEVRADDEADVVDMRLAPVLFRVLGYHDEADWAYNRSNRGGRPDFVVAPNGRLAFFLEDKRTSMDLTLPNHRISDPKRYLIRTTGDRVLNLIPVRARCDEEVHDGCQTRVH